MNKVRKWFRIIHRDLSYLFTGMILVYAISGIVLNHRDTINPDFVITNKTLQIDKSVPVHKEKFTDEYFSVIARQFGEDGKILKSYFQNDSTAKVFISGGSTIEINLNDGKAFYESVKKRPFFHELNWLHFNPKKGWTYFSDLFAVSLIIITLTGIFMNKGKHGLWGRGGIELLIGILIPVLFVLLVK